MTTWRDVQRVWENNPTFSAREIAEKLDCMPEYVRATFRRKQWGKPRAERIVARTTPSKRSVEILVDYRSGMIWKEIAAKHHIAIPTVWEIINRWDPGALGKRTRSRRRKVSA